MFKFDLEQILINIVLDCFMNILKKNFKIFLQVYLLLQIFLCSEFRIQIWFKKEFLSLSLNVVFEIIFIKYIMFLRFGLI